MPYKKKKTTKKHKKLQPDKGQQSSGSYNFWKEMDKSSFKENLQGSSSAKNCDCHKTECSASLLHKDHRKKFGNG